jgi:hypothetical protein
MLLVASPAVPWDAVPTLALALAAAALGAIMPLDLIALLPIVVALVGLGAPVAAVLPLAFGAEAGSVRSRRVAEGYLRPELRARYAGSVRVLPWLVALACVAFG